MVMRRQKTDGAILYSLDVYKERKIRYLLTI